MRIHGMVFATTALAFAMTADTAMAQSDDLNGCWTTGSSTRQTACFGRDGTGAYLLNWKEGHCGGRAHVTRGGGRTVHWEVPRQSNACYQNGSTERLALREYTCRLRGLSMRCREVIYLDDGSVWRDNEDIVFRSR